MTRTKISPDALRMRQLRHALKFKSAAAFARFLGISKARSSNFENGHQVPREMVFLLCEKVDGLTADWIFFGRSRGLSVDLAERLGIWNADTKHQTRGNP